MYRINGLDYDQTTGMFQTPDGEIFTAYTFEPESPAHMATEATTSTLVAVLTRKFSDYTVSSFENKYSWPGGSRMERMLKFEYQGKTSVHNAGMVALTLLRQGEISGIMSLQAEIIVAMNERPATSE